MPNMTYIWEVVSKWLTANLSTIPKVQLWGKAAAEADTAVLVDSDGHLQIDSLTSGLPTGAATETTLASIKTAVQLIDNMISGAEAQVDVVSSALPTGAATETTLADIKTALELIDNMISGAEAQVDSVAALPAGTNTLGNVRIVSHTSGGSSIHRSIDLDESEEEVKSSAGQVYGWYLYNLHATDARFIKFYNGAAADVTVGTTTPVLTIPLAASQGANVFFATGIEFSAGICIAATTGVLDNDTGAPGGQEVVANIFFE
jgi:hypothetical protein